MIIHKHTIANYEAKQGEVKKILLLYSGGLDTSCMIKWLQEEYHAEIVALTIDIGQPSNNMDAIKAKALKIGAAKAIVADLKKEFAEQYVAKAIKANALYEDAYPLATALGRPLMAKKAVEIAEQEGCDAIAHGCTGKGNDQVRLDISITTLNPKMKVIAPVREWGMAREEELEYALKYGIEIPAENKKYSTDENLWGKSSECGILEHPEEIAPDDVFNFVTLPENAPDKPEIIELAFEKGLPISLNGMKMQLHALIEKLNWIAAQHGIGIIDHMEDRIVGLKSREVYEAPAAVCILKAHKDLEKYICTIHENTFKPMLDQKFSYMVYAGLWYDPLMSALASFIDKVNEKVTGTVKLKLYKGSVSVVSRQSPNALYNLNLATYEKAQSFNQQASPGFIELFGLQTKMAYQIQKK